MRVIKRALKTFDPDRLALATMIASPLPMSGWSPQSWQFRISATLVGASQQRRRLDLDHGSGSASLIPRECLRDLVGNPFRGRMRCDIDPDKVSSGQPNDDKDIEQIEADGRNNEQVHGGDVRCMVPQEGAPSLGRRSTSLHHVLRDSGLTDVEAEREQLAMNARRSPQGIFRAHPPDQRAVPHRPSVGFQESGISNASTDGIRLDANARESRGG
jgi:hypothetical protein